MSKARRRWLSLVLASAAWCSAPAYAQTAEDRETARRLMDRGDEYMERADAQEALRLYLAAHEIMHVPTTGIELARAYAALGKLVEARDRALDVLRMPAARDEPRAFVDARAAADSLARELAAQIPQLNVEIVPSEVAQRAILSIDGRDVPTVAAKQPHALNPTEHRLRIVAPGYVAVERRFTLIQGEQFTLRIDLEKTRATESKPGQPQGASGAIGSNLSGRTSPDDRGRTALTWPTWIGFGVGASGLALGSIAGIMSVSRTNSAKMNCVGNSCSPAAKADLDAAMLSANLSNVGFALGIVGVGVGITSWWFSAQRRAPATSSLVVRPTHQGGLLSVEGVLW